MLTYFVKIEGRVAGVRAVESRFQERRPAIIHRQTGAALVVLSRTHNSYFTAKRLHCVYIDNMTLKTLRYCTASASSTRIKQTEHRRSTATYYDSTEIR